MIPTDMARDATWPVLYDSDCGFCRWSLAQRRRRDPQYAHRLQPERKLLAAVGRGDLEPGELSHPLEAVADRVSVRDQPGGGCIHIRVAFQERRERAEQVGLVLLVVGDQREDRV